MTSGVANAACGLCWLVAGSAASSSRRFLLFSLAARKSGCVRACAVTYAVAGRPLCLCGTGGMDKRHRLGWRCQGGICAAKQYVTRVVLAVTRACRYASYLFLWRKMTHTLHLIVSYDATSPHTGYRNTVADS